MLLFERKRRNLYRSCIRFFFFDTVEIVTSIYPLLSCLEIFFLGAFWTHKGPIMKKLISLLLIVSACSISYAESMKFITVLSGPVGTFNKLEAVDPSAAAKGATVNFCTKIGTQGLVKLKGTSSANLSTVTLSDGSTLGSTDGGKFSLSQIELHSGGSLIGGRLLGNTVNVSNAASGKATQLHGNTLTVAGAKTKTLDVKNGASKISVQHDAADMVWSNEYQDDDACKEGSSYDKCKKQYLLKSKGSSAPENCQPTDPRGATFTEECPEGQTGIITVTWDNCTYVKTSSCKDNTSTRYLSNYKCTGLNKPIDMLWAEDCSTTTDSCSDVQRKNLPWNVWHAGAWLADFEQIPSGCSPGQECSSCVLGQKYISGFLFPGKSCFEPNLNSPDMCRLLLVVKYVQCIESTTGIIAQGVSSCTLWSDTEKGNGEDFELNGTL